MFLSKRKDNFLSNWWWTIDKIHLMLLTFLIIFSAIMVTTASPSVAERIGADSFFFIKRQFVFLFIAFCTIIVFSFSSPDFIKKISLIGFIFCLLMMILVLLYGVQIKGAKRWLNIFGISIQPSEFMKPFFAVMLGWIFSQKEKIQNFPGFKISLLCYAVLIGLLLMQPDFGMVIIFSILYAGNLFLAGLSLLWVLSIIILGILGVICAYIYLPHVAQRINSFLYPEVNENYQVVKSLASFQSGGVIGRGPGEGIIKQHLPDSHTDFIFAVVSEELGMITSYFIILIFGTIIIRSLLKVSTNTNAFSSYVVSGIIITFAMQVIINIGVTLNFFPTKGMTLPFISYGGSSMISSSISMGILLSLTRKTFGYNSIKSRKEL